MPFHGILPFSCFYTPRIGCNGCRNHIYAYILPLRRAIWQVPGAFFLCHIIQTKHGDGTLFTDRLNSRKGTVEFRYHKVNAAGHQYCLAAVVIARMSAEHIFIAAASGLEILPHTGTSDNPDSPGSRFFCHCLYLRTFQQFRQACEHGVLMPCNHDVDAFRVNHPHPHRVKA